VYIDIDTHCIFNAINQYKHVLLIALFNGKCFNESITNANTTMMSPETDFFFVTIHKPIIINATFTYAFKISRAQMLLLIQIFTFTVKTMHSWGFLIHGTL